MTLRPPLWRDYREWSGLRAGSRSFLEPWEPEWKEGHLSMYSFWMRVRWSRKSIVARKAFPFLIFCRQSGTLMGSIVIENIREGPANTGSLGYWMGQEYASRGFMSEAIPAVVEYAFSVGISRVEAACLPDNLPSRRVLESSGFACEGIASGYLQIAGSWRDHALYAILRADRARCQ